MPSSGETLHIGDMQGIEMSVIEDLPYIGRNVRPRGDAMATQKPGIGLVPSTWEVPAYGEMLGI